MCNDHITYEDIQRYYWEVTEPAKYLRKGVAAYCQEIIRFPQVEIVGAIDGGPINPSTPLPGAGITWVHAPDVPSHRSP